VIGMPLINREIILYDGHCNLCNASLQFIIKRDKKKVFQFYPIQSKEADLLMSKMFAEKLIPDSVILLSDGQLYTKSEAFFNILPKLGKAYHLFTVFKIIPRKLRDKIYDWIATNRYRWFGKQEQCAVYQSENNN